MQRPWWNGLVICLGLVGCAVAPDASVTARAQGSPAGAAPTGLTCSPGQHVCVRCNGSGTFCAPRCPECAPQLAPVAERLALDSSSTRCPALL